MAARFGASMPLVYKWFQYGAPISEPFVLNIRGGDLYIMSEKATGNDWKKRNIPTLRHAAGCSDYIGRGSTESATSTSARLSESSQ